MECFLIFILFFCFGSEAVLTQTVATGGTVTLSCTFSGGTLVDDTHFPWWIQHRLENVPRRILYRSGIRPSGIPDRFSGSKSGNIMSMTITGALLEDEGDYYCVAWTEDAWHSGQVRWRNETKSCLTLSLPPSLPRQPLLPSDSHQTSDALLRTVFAKPGGARETPASPYFSDEAPVTFGVQAQSTPGKASLEVAAHIPLKVRVVWQFHIVFILLMAWLFSFQGRWLTSSSPSFL
uniref:Ig-like domain-containing protein n=1 Tax=Varanus komodoensis TaxID=61221 RepID=A0A8D2J4A2_VARKO